MTRWDVHLKGTGFEDVGAEYLHVLGGALVFFDDDPSKPTMVYAPGIWNLASKGEE